MRNSFERGRLRARRPAVILHAAPQPDGPPDQRDLLAEVDMVASAAAELGYAVTPLELSLDLETVAMDLAEIEPALVFNLVEDVDGDGRLLDLGPALLESLGLSYTGCSRVAIATTSNKPIAAALLAAAGIDTPAGLDENALLRCRGELDGPYVVKAAHEHASLGLDQGAVVYTADDARHRIRAMRRRYGGTWFGQRYVAGREFCVSLLGPHNDPQVLPVYEIVFTGARRHEHWLVDYAAKWDPHSTCYRDTTRSFEVSDSPELVAELESIGVRAWSSLGLNGYARVDLRVDESGKPWVIEVNANPCISAGAGFAAAAARDGIGATELVSRLAASALPGALRSERFRGPAAQRPLGGRWAC